MKNIVFTFGRCNPPTTGHERVIDSVLKVAMAERADHVIYLSPSTGDKNNPLEWEFKHKAFEASFQGVNISDNNEIKNPFIALSVLSKDYNRITLVAGSDRFLEYELKFGNYARAWNIDFRVVSAATRSTTNSISSTKMRQYAIDGNKKEFLDGLPTSMPNPIRNLVYENTRRKLKLIDSARNTRKHYIAA